jgi:SH3-like domain-containing protein
LASFALIALLAAPRFVRAQEATDPGIENSKYQAEGLINANAVYVRSGASDNDYPVMKLEKGAPVHVVGMRFEWLKIAPPEGSFCYVSKAYVDRHGDGSVGKVTNTLYVRVGSQLNGMKAKVATKLEPGSPVQIIGDQDEYFKIKPPEGVYFYVNKQYVDATKLIDPAAQPKPETNTGVAENNNGSGETNQPKASEQSGTPETTNPLVAEGPTTGPTTEPSTRPTNVANAEEEFDKLESSYAEITKQPLDQQDIPTLLTSYEKFAKADAGLPETLRRIAEAKAGYLKTRVKDKEEFVAVMKQQEEMKQRQIALKAEREELETRLKAADMKYFAAVGVLRPSSLQTGQSTLYRLTDPSTGRTVIYLRSDDNKIGSFIGQFIGVKGEPTTDTQLSVRVITPTEFEPVDPSKLYTKVAAQIVPPSLMPGGATATTGGENESR